ncbi:MAG: sigma-70 family RNA polymerase sigma factor [Actinomycetota bacterium]|nr:sigma-70 family RNA polymerase sigma factor [Actinomycetota bacterium]
MTVPVPYLEDPDVALLRRYRDGDDRAADEFVRRFELVAQQATIGFFLPGGDREDLVQAARVGVWMALRSYEPEHGTRLASYVATLARRKVLEAVTYATREKHRPLTESARSAANEDGERVQILALLPTRDGDPVSTLESRERLAEIARDLRAVMSPVEASCLLAFANGLRYNEIAAALGLRGKAHVDQTLTRARWKLGGGPPSRPDLRPKNVRLYACPGCSGVSRSESLCNVCAFREAA